MMTSVNLLTYLLVGTLAGATITQIVLSHRLQVKWMRIFSEKQGIPATTMEVRPKASEVVTPTVKLKTKAFSMPVPGADMLREMYKAQK